MANTARAAHTLPPSESADESMLATGTRLGPFEVIAPLGTGGMGEVYRARDTRLERSVAIKILQPEFARDPALRQRFEREARAISSLNHAHICALYDIGVHGGTDYIVMELVEGETLNERLKNGPLKLEQALRTAIQIADALDAAHRHGVVHRDLKPANVMLTKAGAKLLDFGLAKVGGVVVGGELNRTRAPALTEEGTLLGTLQYMAPEQLHGKEADARSDIFAFGALLYEMLTGASAFQGESTASVIASILNDDPRALSELQPLTPPALERALKRCLAKDPDDRWQNARDLMHELQWIAQNPAHENAIAASAAGSGAGDRRAWIAAAALGAVAIAATAAWWSGRTTLPARSVRLAIALPANKPFEYFDSAVVSPDGANIAFVGYSADGKQQIWVRALDSDTPRPLDGTEDAHTPFWSPNSRSLAFFADEKLKRIDSAGGPAQVLCDVVSSWGGAWGSDGTIIFCGNDFVSLSRVPDSGGKPVEATRLGPKEEAHRWPSFLPDGRHFVFAADASLTEDHNLKLGSLDDQDSVALVQAVSNVAYAAPGHLLFVRGGNLLAQRFDPKLLRLAGDPVTLAEHVAHSGENHRFEFSASDTGVLTFRSADERRHLTWIDGEQHRTQITTEPKRLGGVSLSPDGAHVAYGQDDVDGRADDIWTLDLLRGVESRVTSDPASDYEPVWSTQGDRIAFASYRAGLGDLYLASAQGKIEERLLLASASNKGAECWSADGKWLFYTVDSNTSGRDIWVLPIDDPSHAHAVVETKVFEGNPRLSPDGRLLAYLSYESGRDELYVQGYPTGVRRQVSRNGAKSQCWRRDGSELYFAEAGTVMAASIKNEPELQVGVPTPLFPIRSADLLGVAPDGRFLLTTPVEDPLDAPITVVIGWDVPLE